MRLLHGFYDMRIGVTANAKSRLQNGVTGNADSSQLEMRNGVTGNAESHLPHDAVSNAPPFHSDMQYCNNYDSESERSIDIE